MNENEKTLAAFRHEIDTLDDKIIDLLIERIEIIARVGEWKRAQYPGQCHIRAGREAEMVRRVMQKFEGSKFNPVAAAAMWRILIGSSVSVESPLSLSIYQPEGNEMYFWLAREYFGPALPVIRQPHVNRVIGDVVDKKASVGIVPTLQAGDASNWWASLLPEDAPKIFARIPFVADGAPGKYPAALAIARIQPEASGNDVSLILLEADHNVSQHRLQTVFAKSGLAPRWISIATPEPSSRHHLIELRSFVTLSDAPLKAILSELGGSVLRVGYLGSYALPIISTILQSTPSHGPTPTPA